MDVENTVANKLHLNSLLTELADTQQPVLRNDMLKNNMERHSEYRKSHKCQKEEDFDDDLEVQFGQPQTSAALSHVS